MATPMKTAFVACAAFALFHLTGCGGEPASAARPDAAPPAPAPTSTPTPSPVEAAATTPAAQDPGKKPIPRPRVDYETIKRLFGNDPTADAVDNPPTPAKIALGRALFHAPLGADGKTSCATCHPLSNYGVDGKPVPAGGSRNAPTVWNAFRQFRQGWDGATATVEDLALAHSLQPSGLGLGDEGKLVAAVRGQPELVAGFAAAFGDGDVVSTANYRLGLGAFLRTLATRSRWEAYLDGDQKALGNEELLGLKTFTEVGCTTCHLTRLGGGHMFQKTGLLKPYASSDTGRMQLTGSDADKSFWKVPQLLNVDKTAPYYHDGKIATLEEAVATMADIQLGRKLTPEQQSALVAFLKAMTGPLPADAGK